MRILCTIVVKGGAASRYENVCKSSSTDVEIVDWVSTYICSKYICGAHAYYILYIHGRIAVLHTSHAHIFVSTHLILGCNITRSFRSTFLSCRFISIYWILIHHQQRESSIIDFFFNSKCSCFKLWILWCARYVCMNLCTLLQICSKKTWKKSKSKFAIQFWTEYLAKSSGWTWLQNPVLSFDV